MPPNPLITPGTTNLDVPAGQTVVLSPTSPQLSGTYQKVSLQTIDQARQILGASRPGRALGRARMAKDVAAIATKPVAVTELKSNVAKKRTEARAQTYRVASEYVRLADPSGLAAWVPALNEFLKIHGAAIKVAALADIVVNDGATLTISPDTQALYANNVTVHGTGKIVCQGPCTLNLTTLKGTT